MNNNYIKLTNFGNDFTNQMASYMIMESGNLKIGSYEYQDIVHNSVYYLDRIGYIDNSSMEEAISKACRESGIDIDLLTQKEVDILVADVMKEYRGY